MTSRCSSRVAIDDVSLLSSENKKIANVKMASKARDVERTVTCVAWLVIVLIDFFQVDFDRVQVSLSVL